MKLIMKFPFELMLTSETNNKDMNKSHQVVGWKVVKISKIEWIFSLIDTIDIKLTVDDDGVNLTNSVLFELVTQTSVEISDI